MSINLRFSEQDWQRIEHDWSAWWAREIDRPMVYLNGWEPQGELPPVHEYASSYPLDFPVERIVADTSKHMEALRYYGDAFPKWWLNFGPGIMAGFVGGEVYPVEETVWFYPPGYPNPAPRIHDLRLRYDPDNAWWRRIYDLTCCAVKAWQGQVCVGHTDLGGNLDILASLVTTQQLLIDVIEAPEEVDRLVRAITDLWVRYYDEQYEVIQTGCVGTTPWAPIWSPGRTYMLQCDFSYMISPKMFERFVMPDLAAICDSLDHGFYHLDGKGEIPHLPLLLSLERLRGIQWIPGDGAPPPDQWLPLLKRIIDGGKLCQVTVTAEGARTIVKELGGKGFCLAISDVMNGEEARGFLNTLMIEDKNYTG